jgi:hypothetical protein
MSWRFWLRPNIQWVRVPHTLALLRLRLLKALMLGLLA